MQQKSPADPAGLFCCRAAARRRSLNQVIAMETEMAQRELSSTTRGSASACC
jgi:hypothetical protein